LIFHDGLNPTLKFPDLVPYHGSKRDRHSVQNGLHAAAGGSLVSDPNLFHLCAASHALPNPVFGEDLPSCPQDKPLIALATPAGLEPATFSLEGCCSIQLSYGAEGYFGHFGCGQ
jgi:hypothetical protein